MLRKKTDPARRKKTPDGLKARAVRSGIAARGNPENIFPLHCDSITVIMGLTGDNDYH